MRESQSTGQNAAFSNSQTLARNYQRGGSWTINPFFSEEYYEGETRFTKIRSRKPTVLTVG